MGRFGTDKTTVVEDDEKKYGKFVVTDGGDLVMGSLGISLDAVLSVAAAKGERPTVGAEVGNPKHLIYELRAAVVALRRKLVVADAARVVHAALQEDEGLLEAVDAAYRLGGAEAVRDLLLRGAAQGRAP